MGVLRVFSLGFFGEMRGSEGVQILLAIVMNEMEGTAVEATSRYSCTYSFPKGFQ